MDTLNLIIGTKEDDPLLFGTGGTDILLGLKGDDVLDGGDGNDLLLGGKGDDLLDGGAGSDVVLAGKGDDTVNFTLSANLGAMDFYDGGKGLDTLQLTLTSAEFETVKEEIDAFEAFLAEGGKVFEFSFGLIVRNFEAFKIVTIDDNTAPVALEDSFTFDEDTPTVLDVLGNDSDADGDSLLPVIVQGPANGALTLVDGILTYTPAENFFGGDSFTYQASDGTALSEVVSVNLMINPVNDLPVAMDDAVTALAELTMPDLIRVLVLGHEDDPLTLPNEGTSHLQAAGQLDPSKFVADWMINTTNTTWATVLSNYDVVVVGDSGYFDYADESTTGLFSALSSFVDNGGGVVTTGWFARALPLITDPTVLGFADHITPIAPSLQHNFAGTGVVGADVITVLDPSHEIAGGLSSFQASARFGWELAGSLDLPDTGATLLATGITTSPDRPTGATLPAIAYDDAVGMGRTAYLGGLYVGSTDFGPDLTRSGVLDEIFERAVAWAAGGGGVPSASATIDDALLLANDSDVETALAGLKIDSVALQNENGAAISLDANGDVVYTPSAAGLQELLAGRSIADSFDYAVIDGDGGTAMASVSLTVTGFTTDTLL